MKAIWDKVQNHPLGSFASIFAGGFFGAFFPRAGAMVGPIGDVLLSLFKMCALPIVVTIIFESFYRLMGRGDRTSFILRTFAIFGLSAAGATLLGVGFGRFLSGIVVADAGLMSFLSRQMSAQPHSAAVAPRDAVDFFVNFIPQNIFRSLAEGQILACLVFFALFGSALARIPSARREDVYEIVGAIKAALFRMLDWFIQFLPIAVFAIFARTFAGMGGEGARMLGKLTLLCAAPIVTLVALQAATLFVLRRTKVAPAWRALREPLLIAFSSTSSIVALPSAMKNLGERGKVQPWAAETIMPLSTTFNQQSAFVTVSFLVTFCAQISGVAVSGKLVPFVAFGAVIHALSSSGLPALATLGTLAMIFGPLGLPVDLVVVFMIAVMPFLSPIVASANLLGHAWTVLMLERRAEPEARAEERKSA